MSNEENKPNEATESSKPKRKRVKNVKPMTQSKLTLADKVVARHKAGLNMNQIAAQLMIHKERVEEILVSRNENI